MIGVFVTFRYGDNFDEQAVRKIAETARAKFEGMPGLRSKAFTVNSGKREATNFYVWDSEDAAKSPCSGRMTPNHAFERTDASALRLLAVPSLLRPSAAAQRERCAAH